MWGYACVHGGRTAPERGSYHHPCFVRSRPDLCRQMKRCKLKSASAKAKGAKAKEWGAPTPHQSADELLPVACKKSGVEEVALPLSNAAPQDTSFVGSFQHGHRHSSSEIASRNDQSVMSSMWTSSAVGNDVASSTPPPVAVASSSPAALNEAAIDPIHELALLPFPFPSPSSGTTLAPPQMAPPSAQYGRLPSISVPPLPTSASDGNHTVSSGIDAVDEMILSSLLSDDVLLNEAGRALDDVPPQHYAPLANSPVEDAAAVPKSGDETLNSPRDSMLPRATGNDLDHPVGAPSSFCAMDDRRIAPSSHCQKQPAFSISDTLDALLGPSPPRKHFA